jgi:hypothetical protein
MAANEVMTRTLYSFRTHFSAMPGVGMNESIAKGVSALRNQKRTFRTRPAARICEIECRCQMGRVVWELGRDNG